MPSTPGVKCCGFYVNVLVLLTPNSDTRAYTHTHMHTHMHAYTHKYKHSLTHIHIHTQPHKHIHNQITQHQPSCTICVKTSGISTLVDLAKPALLGVAVVAERAVCKGAYLPHFDSARRSSERSAADSARSPPTYSLAQSPSNGLTATYTLLRVDTAASCTLPMTENA